MIKRLQKYFFCAAIFFAGFTTQAQSYVYFYAPSEDYLGSQTAEIKDGDRTIASLTQNKFIGYPTGNGEKTFRIQIGSKSHDLTLELDNGIYFVRCGFLAVGSARLRLRDLHDASIVLPVSVTDSLEQQIIKNLGAMRVAVVPVISDEVEDLAAVVKDDSLLLRWDEAGSSIGRKPKTQLQWISTAGVGGKVKTLLTGDDVIWSACTDGTLYYTPASDLGKTTNIFWTGTATTQVTPVVIDGRYLAAWDEGNQFFLLTAEKGRKVLTMSTFLNGSVVSTKDFQLPFEVVSARNDGTQFITASFDFDDPYQNARTKIYLRPGKLIVTRTDEGLVNERFVDVRSFVASLDLASGSVENITLFPGQALYDGLNCTIAGDYCIWLLKGTMIKIISLDKGNEIAAISLAKQLPHKNFMLRRYDKMKPGIIPVKIGTSRVSFVTGDINADGGLVLRAGIRDIKKATPVLVPTPMSIIGLAVTTASIAIRAAGQAKIMDEYFFLNWKAGSPPTALNEVKTIQQRVDALEMLFNSLGYDVVNWNYALTKNSVYAIYQRKDEKALRVFRITK